MDHSKPVGNIASLMGGPIHYIRARQVDPPEVQLRDAIERAGLKPPAVIHFDGKLHRFDSDDKGHKAGWYIVYGDGVPAGSYGCWRAGLESNWCADVGRDLTAAEIAEQQQRLGEARRVRERERAEQLAHTREAMAYIWRTAGPASEDHPYLARKRIGVHGLRVAGDGRLIVPMRGPEGMIDCLQYIAADGGKLYHPGGKAGGAALMLGDPDHRGPVYVAEGLATAASIAEVTKCRVWAAFSANNLPAVAERARASDPAAELVIVADNDASGVGLNYAMQAAAKSGGRVVVMPEVGQDANDYRNAGGDLLSLLRESSAEESWLTAADDLLQQPAAIAWLVKGILQREALHMIHGPSGCGKSFVAISLSLALATAAESFAGRKVRGGSVVYCAGEGHHGIRARLAAHRQRMGWRGAKLHVSNSGCDLNTVEGLNKVRQAIARLPERPVCIVIDTLHRFLKGDENRPDDVKAMIDACDALRREFGCAVVLIHHTGLSESAQDRARGSSAWRGAVDIEINIQRLAEDRVGLKQLKAKDSEPFEPFQLALERVTIDGWKDEDGEPVVSLVARELEPTEGSVTPESPAKKEAADSAAWNRYLTAWEGCGMEVDAETGRPYVTRSGAKAYLERCGVNANSIKTWIHRDVPKMLKLAILREHGHGWIVCDAGRASMLLLHRGHKQSQA